MEGGWEQSEAASVEPMHGCMCMRACLHMALPQCVCVLPPLQAEAVIAVLEEKEEDE